MSGDDEPAGDAPVRVPAPAPRAGQAVFALTLALAAAGLLYLGFAPQHWLRGVLVVGAGLTLAGMLRLGLADHRAGPLLVRGRWFDGVCYLLAGLAVVGVGVLVRIR